MTKYQKSVVDAILNFTKESGSVKIWECHYGPPPYLTEEEEEEEDYDDVGEWLTREMPACKVSWVDAISKNFMFLKLDFTRVYVPKQFVEEFEEICWDDWDDEDKKTPDDVLTEEQLDVEVSQIIKETVFPLKREEVWFGAMMDWIEEKGFDYRVSGLVHKTPKADANKAVHFTYFRQVLAYRMFIHFRVPRK